MACLTPGTAGGWGPGPKPKQPHLQSLASVSRPGRWALSAGCWVSPLAPPPQKQTIRAPQAWARAWGLGVGEAEAGDAHRALGPLKVSHGSLLLHKGHVPHGHASEPPVLTSQPAPPTLPRNH